MASVRPSLVPAVSSPAPAAMQRSRPADLSPIWIRRGISVRPCCEYFINSDLYRYDASPRVPLYRGSNVGDPPAGRRKAARMAGSLCLAKSYNARPAERCGYDYHDGLAVG